MKLRCVVFLLTFVLVAAANVMADSLDYNSKWREEIAVQMPRESAIANNLWRGVLEKGVVSSYGLGNDRRRVFTLMQKIVEQKIIRGLSLGRIKGAVMVIHSPNPATPLLIGSGDSGLNYKKLNISPKSKVILYKRHIALRRYLKAGGILASVYKSFNKVNGYKIYLDIVNKHKNLIDRKVKDIPEKDWGATYFIRQLDDSIYAFSISSEQAQSHQVGKGLEVWKIWFGGLLNREVSKRVVQIESFLKSEDIDVYKCLGLRGE